MAGAGHAESITDDSIHNAFTDKTYTVVYYQYAYDASGTVSLYDYGSNDVCATLESGSKVAVTDMQENGRTFVMFGGTSGWAKNSSLVSKLPEDTSKKEDGLSYQYVICPGKPSTEVYQDAAGTQLRGYLDHGTLVAVHETSGNMSRITFGGYNVWIPTRNLTFLDPNKDQNNSGSSGTKRPSSSNKTTKKAPVAPLSVTVNGEKATLQQLGTITSTVLLKDAKTTIATSDLQFETTAPAGKRIAFIHAPNTGKCTLRDKASGSGASLKQCKAGTVVAVLKYGESFCQVQYKDNVGYVKTNCLKFPGENVQTLGSATLTYNGRATGSTSINIRNTASKDSAKVAQWETGTEVTVFSQENGWYEIEANGIHGWVMDDFLTL